MKGFLLIFPRGWVGSLVCSCSRLRGGRKGPRPHSVWTTAQVVLNRWPRLFPASTLPGEQPWFEGCWKEFSNLAFSTGLSDAFIVSFIRSRGVYSAHFCLLRSLTKTTGLPSCLRVRASPPSVAPSWAGLPSPDSKEGGREDAADNYGGQQA